MPNTSTIYSHYNPELLIWEYAIQKQDTLNPVSYRPDLATDSLISEKVDTFHPLITQKTEHDYLGSIAYMTGFLIIFAFIRLRGKNLLSVLMQVMIQRKKTELILNEGIMSNLINYTLALTLSFSSFAIATVYLLTEEFTLLYIAIVFGILFCYHFLKLSLISFLGWTFNYTHTADEVISNQWTFNIMSGILISPLIIAIFFVQIFAIPLILKITVICTVLFYLWRFIRWIEILFSHNISILYMILYLCAVEVMPLLVLYKLAT